MAASRARTNSPAGIASAPAGRSAAKAVPSRRRRCAGGGISDSSCSRRRAPPVLCVAPLSSS
eukprot:4540217-Pleurochrysis_carterae.AAC.1